VKKVTKKIGPFPRAWFCPPVSRVEGRLTLGVLAAMAALDLGLGLWWQGLVIAVLAFGALGCLVRDASSGRTT